MMLRFVVKQGLSKTQTPYTPRMFCGAMSVPEGVVLLETLNWSYWPEAAVKTELRVWGFVCPEWR